MAQYELSLYDYWRIIRRRKFILFFTFAAVILFTWIFTNMQTQIFQATTTVKVEPTLVVPGVATEALGWDILTAINTEVKIIKSAIVAERTAKKLGLISDEMTDEQKTAVINSIASKIDAERIGDTNLIKIICTSSLPEETAIIANATAEVYIEKGIEDRSRRAKELREFIEKQLLDAEQKLKESEEKLRKFTEESGVTGVGGHLALRLLDLQTKKADMLKKYTEKHPDVIDLNNKIKTTEEQMKTLPKEELEHARLTRTLRLNEDMFALLAKRHKEAQISEADRVVSASIVTPATTPRSPIRPNRVTNFSIGSLIGILLGFVFALVAEHLDTSIGTIEDVETYLQIPVIGIVPHIESKGRERFFDIRKFRHKLDVTDLRSKLIIYHSAKSPFVEAYHTLRTNIKFAKEEITPAKTKLMFTSTGVAEGKTLTGVNFALAAAQTGIRTIYIECDLRRPAVHKLFGLRRIPGFTDCITGKVRWMEILRGTTDFLLGELELEKLLHTPGLENFKLLPCGSVPPNPIDLLNSAYIGDLFEELKEHFELIVVDAPPVLLFADALLLSKFVDTTILVYRVGRIARGAVKRAKEQLAGVKANVLGVVLNDIRAAEMEPRYGYYYAYKYYAKEEKVK
ncbi:MAG: polysaccharide biosynthesis tyrosine autokinase [Elusimicrobiota bacterium]|nr:polysaccharide biosynthesis tyrosine autokinase [Elusimicrobiota bacterium]